MILGNDLNNLREGIILAKEGLENGTCPDRNNSNCDVATSFLMYFNEEETVQIFEKMLEIPLNSSILMEEGITGLNGSEFELIKVDDLKIVDSVKKYPKTIYFYGSKIKKLTLSKKAVDIPDYLIPQYSDKIKSDIENLIIPYGVKKIGIQSFKSVGLKHIEIPSSVTSIGASAFEDNDLTVVSLPNSITQIGSSAFYNNQITDINIPDKLTVISSSVFCGNKLTKITIPNSVEEIGVNAFRSNELTEAIIPNGVKIIRNSAFENNALINIEIPKSVEKIYYYAFKDNPIELIKYDATNATLYKYGVSNYGLDLFGNTGDGTKVIIGKNVKTIPDKLFSMSQKGSKVKEVYIYNGVTKIGSSSFYDNQIETVRLPNTLTSIGTSAFRKNKLTRIVIPEKVASIGNYAFSDNDLTSVTILGNKTRFNSTWTNKGFPEELKPVN